MSPRYCLQVYQTISEGRLNNVVELYGRYNLPALPGMNVEPIVATATLKHMLRVSGVRRLEITFEDTELKATGACLGFRVCLCHMARVCDCPACHLVRGGKEVCNVASVK